MPDLNNGWPGKPGVPLNPERDGWHWLLAPDGDQFPCLWRVVGIDKKGPWPMVWNYDPEGWAPEECKYIAPCLAPAEAEARVKEARRDALEEAARWHDEQAAEAQKLSDMKVSALDSKVWGDYATNHREYAAAIRALKGEGNE